MISTQNTVVETYGYVLLEVSPFSSGSIATTQKGEEIARKQSVELQEEVVDCHVEVKVERLRR